MFTDSNGIEIKKASWGQKVNVWINHKNLEDEDFIFTVIHENTTVHVQTIKAFNQYLIPLSLDEFMHKKVGKIGKLQIKITTPNLKVIGDGVAFPKAPFDVQDTPEVYEAHIGSEDGKDKHTIVDYDKVSWFYAKSRGIKPTENLRLEIRQSMFGISFSPDSDKLLLDADNVRPDDSGMIKIRLPWSEVKPKIYIRNVYAVIKNSKGTILHSTGYVFGNIVALVQNSTVVKLAEYKSAVMVKGDPVNKSENNGICKCEAKVRAFMRMIRVGEGTEDEGGYQRIVGGSTFKDHGKDMSTHPDIYIKEHNSRAAGAYQITMNNWNDKPFEKWRTNKKITDFTELSQDKYCVYLIKDKKKALDLIKKDKISEAIAKCRTEWASLPGAGYGQREEKLSNILKKYDEYYKEELNGKSTLHIKKGFLKEFGDSCCENKDNVKEIENEVTLHYDGETAIATALSNKTKNVLKEVGKISGNYNIYITSTARTSQDQARIMYDNCESKGASYQKGVYAASGDKVIDVYIAGKKAGNSQEQIITDMKNKINEVGPDKVSKHLANPDVLNTFDISYSRLTDKTKFWNEIKKRDELDEILVENNCYHIQINQ
jgi:muramidase (phage lysozyme)